MSKSHCTYSTKVRSTERLEAIRVRSGSYGTLGALADHVLSSEDLSKEERPMCAERTENVSQITLKVAIASIFALVEDAVNALVSPGNHNGVSRTDNRREAMPQGLVRKAIAYKLRSVELQNRLLRRIENVTSSPRNLTRTTEAMLENKGFITPVATIDMRETEKAVDVDWKKEDRHRKFVKAAYSTGRRSASSSDRYFTAISCKRTNKKA